MSNDVKEFLRRMASEAPTRSGIPPRLPRRVRRRRLVTVAASVTAIAVAAYGGTVAVQALRRPSTVLPATPSACSWETVPAPRFGPEGFKNRLLDISVAPDGSAWAVGDIYEDEGEGSEQESLALRWTGDEWTVVDHPPLQSLRGVATIGANDAWAVGFHGNQDVALHWNGEGWAEVPLADPGSKYWGVDDLEKSAGGDLWAVGGTVDEWAGTLVQRWNGEAWQIVSSPPQSDGTGYATLEGVAAVRADLAWAVGESGELPPAGPKDPLVIRWDGHSWQEIETPDVPAEGRPFSYLFAVAGVPSGEAWAVGISNSTPGIGGGGDHALALHGDAEGWSASQLPPLPEDSRLFGIAARSPTEVFAVGSTGFVGTYETLVLRWDGLVWERVALPVEEGSLLAATVDLASNVWVVGQTADGKPLVLRCDAGG